MRNIFLIIIMVLGVTQLCFADIWDEIRNTAMSPNNDPNNGRALPLAAGWQDGKYKYYYGLPYKSGTFLEPSYMISLIQQQHHLLVGFWQTTPEESSSLFLTRYNDYIGGALDTLKQHNQPLVLVAGNYSNEFFLFDKYSNLPVNQNPRVLNVLKHRILQSP